MEMETLAIIPPVDGRGGSLWNSSIIFPIYPSVINPTGGYTNATWAHLDIIFNENEQLNATAGICFGFCILSFLNILALAPRAKRCLPLYSYTLLALAILATRYLSLMVMFTALEGGSAYYKVAADFADGTSIKSTVASLLIIWSPPFAIIFVVLCLYIQGKCVMVLIAARHHYLHLGIFSYLIVLSTFTIVFRIAFAACATVAQFNDLYTVPTYMHQVVLGTYSTTILSWCLVCSWQVGSCVLTRLRMGISLNKSEGIAILFMTSVESMVIPMIFTILQFSEISWFKYSEFLIMPSIACIIPFGSIWASCANAHAALQRARGGGQRSPCNTCGGMATPSLENGELG